MWSLEELKLVPEHRKRHEFGCLLGHVNPLISQLCVDFIGHYIVTLDFEQTSVGSSNLIEWILTSFFALSRYSSAARRRKVLPGPPYRGAIVVHWASSTNALSKPEKKSSAVASLNARSRG